MKKLWLIVCFSQGLILLGQVYVVGETDDGRQSFRIQEVISFSAYNAWDSRILDYTWDWGDGTSSEGQAVQHQYSQVGSYFVSLRGKAPDGEQSDPFYLWIFIMPQSAVTNVQGLIVSPQENWVQKAGQSQTLFAESDIQGAEFFWWLQGTDIFFQGNSWNFTPPGFLTEDYGAVLLAILAPDGSVSSYPEYRNFYVYENNQPPEAVITEPQLELVEGEKRLTLYPGQSQTFKGTATDADGPLPVTLIWYNDQDGSETEGTEWTYTAQEPGFFYFSLNAVDGDDQWDPFPDDFHIFVRGENQAPEIWCQTSSQTVGVGDDIEFSVEYDDPEGDEVSFLWDFGDGETASSQTLTKSFDTGGAYRVTVKAQDALGAWSDPYQIWIFINDYVAQGTNQSPYVTMQEPQMGSMYPVNETVTFQAYGYDPEGDTQLTYYWDFNDGTLATGSATQTHQYPVPESYWVSVFVMDSKGFASYYEGFASIAIYDGELPPDGLILSPDPEPDEYGERIVQIKPGESLELIGQVKGVEDVSGYRAEWWMDDQIIAAGFQPGAYQFDVPGYHYVNLEVINPDGLRDPIPAEFTLWVRDYNTPPEVWMEEPGWETPIEVSEYINLAGSYYDEENDAVQLNWTLSDGRSFVGERIDEVCFSDPGLQWVQLQGVDSEGGVSETYMRRYIIVYSDFDWDLQVPPDVYRLRPEAEQFIGPRNSQFQFAAEAVDFLGEAITGWFWDFGNGGVSSEQFPDPVYFQKPGYYEVKVFARDASGLWSFYPATWEVGIYGDNVPPNGVITQPALGDETDSWEARLVEIPQNTQLTFSGTAEDPDGNLPLSMEWWFDGDESYMLGTTAQIGPISFPDVGFFSVSLEVTDSKGEWDPISDYRTIHVIDPNKKPVAYIGYPDSDLTVEPGEELWFYGYGEDPNDLEMTYHWDFGPNATPSEAEGMDVFPVVFQETTPEGQPIQVTMTALTAFTQSDPVVVNIAVRQYQDQDFEPNDQLAQAFPLDLGTYSKLSLGSTDTKDCFKFVVDESSRNLKLRLQADAGDQGFITKLYQQDGTNWTLLDIDPGLYGKDTKVLQNLQPGTYALEITHQNANKSSKDGISYGIGVSTEKPVLYVPFLVEDGNLSSEFGVINPTSGTVDLSIAGLDGTGKTISTKNIQLLAGERFFKKGLEFFGVLNSIEQARLIRWIRIQSPERLIGFSNSRSLDGTQLMSSGAFKTLSSQIIIPHVAQQTQQWYTRAILINAGESEIGLEFQDGTTFTGLGSMKTNNQQDFRFSEVFSQNLPGWGRFSQNSGKAVLAGVEIFGRKDGVQQVAALEMTPEKRDNPNFTYIRNNLYLTHVAKDTANFWTGMTLVNTEGQNQTCRIKAYSDDGQVLATLDQAFEPYGKLLSTVENLFPGIAGISWLEVEADRGLSGFILFGDHTNKRLAGFPAAGFLTDQLIFPYVDESDVSWTGIAVLNIGEESVSVDVEGFSSKGNSLLTTSFNLLPKTKKVATVGQLFSGQTLPEDLSYLVLKADKKVINGFELFGSIENGALGETLAGLSAQTN